MKVGQQIESIEVEAYVPGQSGAQRIDVAGYEGTWVVLVFYPRDFTFVCPTELNALAEPEPAFAAEDAVVLAASTDSYWSHRAWFGSHPALAEAGYPVLADTAHVLSETFGVLTEDGSALRGTFVIDPEGVVRHASVTDQNVGRNAEEILRVLQALRTGELCPASWKPGQPTLLAA